MWISAPCTGSRLHLRPSSGGKRPEWLHGIRIWTTDEQGTVTEVVGVAGQGVSIATTQLLPVADPKAGGAWNQELREILNQARRCSLGTMQSRHRCAQRHGRAGPWFFIRDPPLLVTQGDAVVLAWGAGVDASTVERILASAAPPPPAELRLTGRESMSPADMASAKERAQKAGLPDGWVFDGTFFRDSWGKASVDHPCLDKAVEEWLAERNRTLVEQHERAQRLWADVLPIRARLLRS